MGADLNKSTHSKRLPGLVALSEAFAELGDLESLPYFQQLQLQFTAHIRNPQQFNYQPETEKPIEARRLKIYEELFFNNLQDFFSQLFPVCNEILGESRWLLLVREYMAKHKAQTPLFHELGEEFLDFLQTEYTPLENDPEFLLELAHYEWVELALGVSEEQGFDSDNQSEIDLQLEYEISPVAWLLAYEWPVHQLSEENQPKTKPNQATTLLVYSENSEQERIDFMVLTPLLYQWLLSFKSGVSAYDSLLAISEPLLASKQIKLEELTEFAVQTLQKLQGLGVVKAA
ncbi:DUF2063 domain-containing protein [Thiomicrorhabdus sp. Milos-T2]|uniref:HvfC family RiPP maturation protein n=1 Tax=Thiomicrorhabdus sp. Milos-T2 TaxID=90814 RepID=UPI00068C3E27|nr:putative DNA-binding domain-containing protein [Thiomicrorhabdus sp. Milos-T2]